MFNDRIDKLIKERFKNQRDAALKLGLHPSTISRRVKSEKEEKIIATIQAIVAELHLSPEDLFELIVGNKPQVIDNTDNCNDLIQSQRDQITFLKSEIERLHNQLDKTLDKITTSTENTPSNNESKTLTSNAGKEGKERMRDDKQKIPDHALH